MKQYKFLGKGHIIFDATVSDKNAFYYHISEYDS